MYTYRGLFILCINNTTKKVLAESCMYDIVNVCLKYLCKYQYAIIRIIKKLKKNKKKYIFVYEYVVNILHERR